MSYLPDTSIAPWIHNLLAWSYDPTLASSSTAPSAGVLRVIKMPVPITMTFAKFWVDINVGGTGATSLANCYVGLYDSTGARFATSADQSAAWATTGAKSATLIVDGGKSLTVPGGPTTFVYGAFLVGQQSTTQVQHARSSTLTTGVNAGLSAGTDPLRFATTGSGLTALPTSFTIASLAAEISYWCALA